MTPLFDALNGFGRWLMEHLWTVSVELAILTALVIAALAVLRVKSPAVRHLFWCLVLIKPLTTILVASPVSLYGFFESQPAPTVFPAAAMDVTGDVRSVPADMETMTKQGTYGRRQVSIERPSIEQEPTLDRYGIAALVYLLAAAGLGLRLLLGYAYVSFLRHTAHVQRDGPLAELLARTADRMGMRCRGTLAVSNVAHSPVLAGVVRPVVLLPEPIARGLSSRQLEYIIAHELTHLRRWDNLILLAQRVAEMALFFHPAIWLCGRALRREAEAACDDAVLRRFDGPAGYADSLTRVAETRDGLTRRLLVNPFAAAESNLAARVRRLLRGPAGRTSVALGVVSMVTLVIIGAVGLPTVRARTSTAASGISDHTAIRNGDLHMPTQFQYGFRVDPMQFVANDRSIEGAIVRTLVFGDPQPGDDQLIEDELAKTKAFEPRAEDGGGVCSGPPYNFNAENLLRLTLLGATEDHPEIRRALGLLEMIPKRPREPIHGDALHTLCLLGRADQPAVHHSLRMSIEAADKWIRPLSGCPWTPSGDLPALWAARDLENTASIVERGLRGIRDEMAETGCLGFMDPWSFVNCAAHIDHPIAREILIKQIPMLLRAQQPDGGWGENTFKVFAALKKHGLLDELRAKPPLPPDWKVMRSIPAPGGELWGFVWDGKRLWTGVRATNEALAMSPQDGRILKRIKLPDGHGRWLGWWDGNLAVTQGGPPKNDAKRLLQIDPEDGHLLQAVSLAKVEHVGGVVQVDGELWLFDAFFGSRYVLHAASPRSPSHTHDEGDLPCACPIAANPAGDGAAWLVDAWGPWIVKTDRDRRLLDWSERPFGGFSGVAWDGGQLWAIDQANGRICVIEKTDTAPRPPGRTGGASFGQ
ncbi:MAG: M56 family metallopeptidase [bacterium]|nr:M56 family metallopeptidase [bacterium]